MVIGDHGDGQTSPFDQFGHILGAELFGIFLEMIFDETIDISGGGWPKVVFGYGNYFAVEYRIFSHLNLLNLPEPFGSFGDKVVADTNNEQEDINNKQ